MKTRATLSEAKSLISLVIYLLLGGIFSACAPVNQANDHLASMDQSTHTLAQSVSDDQQFIKIATEQMTLMQKNTEKLENELEADREYLKSVSECMKGLMQSLAAIEKLGDGALHAVMQVLLKPATPDPKTPDANDLLPPAH